MNKILLLAKKISKRYDAENEILNNLSFELNNGTILGVFGENGSGKTTLIKIIAQLLKPSSGKIELYINSKTIIKDNIMNYIGFNAPYLNIYDEFTPLELIMFISKLKTKSYNELLISNYLKLFKLSEKKDLPVKTLSSGMLSKLKFILALIHEPSILIFDEPESNLDDEGIEIIKNIILENKNKGNIVVFASNNQEFKCIYDNIIELQKLN